MDTTIARTNPIDRSCGPWREAVAVPIRCEPLVWPDDVEAAITLLTSNEWPYHAISTLSAEQAGAIDLAGDDVATFWVCADEQRIGLIRVFDLTDLPMGSPLFDVRIAQAHRGRGVGRAAVSWLTEHLFGTHAELHRIEATTRHDNVAMQRVLDRCGYRLEGRMLEAWTNSDGSRADTWTYAILRREWLMHR